MWGILNEGVNHWIPFVSMYDWYGGRQGGCSTFSDAPLGENMQFQSEVVSQQNHCFEFISQRQPGCIVSMIETRCVPR